MPLDYSRPRISVARSSVNKNRPKKQAAGVFAIVILGALSVTFVAGVLTGWFIFRHAAKKAAATAAVTAGQQEAALAQGGAPLPAGGEGRVQEPSLTFYETLPKGGKAVIGTGLNPKREEASPAAKPGATAPSPQAPTQPAPASAASAGAGGAKEEGAKTPEKANSSARIQEQEATVKKPAPGKGKFCVQVASYKDRKEAEAVRAKAAARGLDAYIVESNVPDKGVWYRIRVGRHLEQAEANEAVKKAGKGAIVIAE
jgi:cell division protein FtsN